MRSARSDLLVPAALFLAVVLAPAAFAQDSQYWTQQYGNEARLLGGAVVGGAADLSATYYNPGRLALVGTPKLLLAGNVFEYTSLKLNGSRDGAELASSRLGSVPSLFAGMIGRPQGDDSRFAYSVLGRQFGDLRIEERRDLTDLVAFPSDLATASFGVEETMSEYWAGLTWSKPLNDHVGLGVSGYATIRSQTSRTLLLTQTALADAAGLALQRRDFNYNHWGLVAKVGLGADLGDWNLGLTATTPNLKIWGSGNLGYDESIVSQDVDGDGEDVSQIISGYQPDLDADYEWAPSVAFGASRRWGVTTVHLASEWFAGVPGYVVMDMAPITSSDGTVTREQDVRDERNTVLNFAVGVEHEFREALYGYASFRTDFTSAEIGRAGQIAVSVWDIYHLAGGTTFRALGSDFTLGLIYAFGNATIPTEIDLVPETGEANELTDGAVIDAEFRRLTGLIGFAFGF